MKFVAMYAAFCNFRLHEYMRLLESEVKCGQRILIQCFNELMHFTFIAFSLQPKFVVVVCITVIRIGGVRLVTRLDLAYYSKENRKF
jgi:hypothetical protein